FFFSSRSRHTRFSRDWSSDVCSSDLAADARTDSDFFLIARTDAIAVEGVDAAIERAIRCVEAGADGIFAEAAYDLPTYKRFVEEIGRASCRERVWGRERAGGRERQDG